MRILYKKGDYKQAEKELQLALTVQPFNQTVLFHIASLLAKSGDTKKAVTYLNQALNIKKGFPKRNEAEKLLKKISKKG